MSALTMHVYQESDGAHPVLVLLHGFPVDHRMWDDVACLLPPDVTVVAPDLPFLGRSTVASHAVGDRASAEPSLDVSADAVAAVIARSGRGPVIVVGLSMGGYVALALLDRHPGLVHGLALLDTKSTADADDARANRLRIAAQSEADGDVGPVLGMASATLGATSRESRPELVERLDGWIREQPPAGVAWSQRAMAERPDRTYVLEAFDGPALVVVGEEDEITPPAGAEQMAAVLGDVQVVVVPGAGHMSPVEDPVTVADALARLVRRVTERHDVQGGDSAGH